MWDGNIQEFQLPDIPPSVRNFYVCRRWPLVYIDNRALIYNLFVPSLGDFQVEKGMP